MAAAVFFLIAILVAVVVANQPRAPVQPPAALEDFDVPTAEAGREVPVVFGDVTVKSPNIVWFGDLSYQPVRTKGGK